MKHLTKKRYHKAHTSMSRPHPNRKNKLRVDKKAERQAGKEEALENINGLPIQMRD